MSTFLGSLSKRGVWSFLGKKAFRPESMGQRLEGHPPTSSSGLSNGQGLLQPARPCASALQASSPRRPYRTLKRRGPILKQGRRPTLKQRKGKGQIRLSTWGQRCRDSSAPAEEWVPSASTCNHNFLSGALFLLRRRRALTIMGLYHKQGRLKEYGQIRL